MIHTIDKLGHILKVQLGMTQSAVNLVDDLRADETPSPPIEDLLFDEPPPLDGDVDPRVASLYELLWEHRDDTLARFYEPERIYIGRALYKLLLTLPDDKAVSTSSLLAAAKASFFLQIREKWHRVRVEVVPTGLASFETVVKSTDVLLTGILWEMRKAGLLDGIETST